MDRKRSSTRIAIWWFESRADFYRRISKRASSRMAITIRQQIQNQGRLNLRQQGLWL